MGLADTAEGSEIAASLAALRRSTTQWLLRERGRARLETGVEGLDALLAGGWPQGRVSEVVGAASSGVSGLAAATVAAATGRGEVAAWIDLAEALDPPTLREAGVELGQVLWVRPRGVEEAVRAAELILGTGGFPLVVIDLAVQVGGAAGHRRDPSRRAQGRHGRRPPVSGGGRGRGTAALPLRLARAVERAAAVALVLVGRPWAGTLAAVSVALERGRSLWGGEGRDGPRWLAGLVATVRLDRGGVDDRLRSATIRFEQGSWLRVPVPGDGGRDQGEALERESSRGRDSRGRVGEDGPVTTLSWSPQPRAGGGCREGWAG